MVFEYDINDDTAKYPLNLLEKCSEKHLHNFISHRKSQVKYIYISNQQCFSDWSSNVLTWFEFASNVPALGYGPLGLGST